MDLRQMAFRILGRILSFYACIFIKIVLFCLQLFKTESIGGIRIKRLLSAALILLLLLSMLPAASAVTTESVTGEAYTVKDCFCRLAI